MSGPTTGSAETLADLSTRIRDYLTEQTDVTSPGIHATALTALLASDWMKRHDAEVRAEVLREVADAWTRGAWSDVMLPKPTPPAVPVIAYANRVGDWLRDRADERCPYCGSGRLSDDGSTVECDDCGRLL